MLHEVRPEGAEAPSPGQRPGYNSFKGKAPCKGKSVDNECFCPYMAYYYNIRLPRRCPGLGAIWAFSPHCLSFDTPSNLSQALIISVIYSTSRYWG